MIQKLEVLENELVQTKNETPSDRLRFPVMLRDRIEGLISVVAVAEAAPPQQAHEVFQHLKGLLAEKTSSMQQLLSVDLLTLKELAQKQTSNSLRNEVSINQNLIKLTFADFLVRRLTRWAKAPFCL